MQVWTDLCNMKCSYATGNHFVPVTVGRTSILNFPAKIWTGMCRALLCGDDSSHSRQSGKRLLLVSRGHPPRILAYQGSCIDPTHQSHTLDPTLKAAFQKLSAAIRLLIKDMVYLVLCVLESQKPMLFYRFRLWGTIVLLWLQENTVIKSGVTHFFVQTL